MYDEVFVIKNTKGEYDVTTSSNLCGKLEHRSDGTFFIDKQQLLTSPGWKELLPFADKNVCVKGIRYQQSFRVYLIDDKEKSNGLLPQINK